MGVQASRTVAILVSEAVSRWRNSVVETWFSKMIFCSSGRTSVFSWQDQVKKESKTVKSSTFSVHQKIFSQGTKNETIENEKNNVFQKHWKVSVQASRTVAILVWKVVSRRQNLVVEHCFSKMSFQSSGITRVVSCQDWAKIFTFSKKVIVLIDFESFIEDRKFFNVPKTVDFWTFRAPIPDLQISPDKMGSHFGQS